MEAGKDPAAPPEPDTEVAAAGRELLLLIDEFEQFVNERPRVPLTGRVLLDEEDLYELVDQLRRAVPHEVQRAMKLLAERDRILEQAEAEAEQTVADARRYAERLTDESAISRRAQEEADRLLAGAREESRRLRRDGDRYAEQVLARLEEALGQTLEQVRRGRQFLQARDGEGPEEADAPASENEG